MTVYMARMQNKQGFLFRMVDIANEMFAMAASVSRADAMAKSGHPEAAQARRLADLFCRQSRRKVDRLFHQLWHNDDVLKYKMGLSVLEGTQAWMEEGSLGVFPIRTAEQAPEFVLAESERVGSGVRPG